MAKQTRAHLIEKAFELFLVHGYSGCTFRQLVANAGLSKGAFYHYFSSKEQIYEAVLQTQFIDHLPNAAVVSDAAANAADVAAFLQPRWQPYADLLDTVQQRHGSLLLYHRFLHEALVSSAALRARIAAYVAELQQSIAAYLPQFGLRDRVSETLGATIVHAVIEGVGVLCAFEQSTRPSARFQTIIGGLAEAIAPMTRSDNA